MVDSSITRLTVSLSTLSMPALNFPKSNAALSTRDALGLHYSSGTKVSY